MEARAKNAVIGGLAALLGTAESVLYRPWDRGINALLTAPLRALDNGGALEELFHSVPDYFSGLGAVHEYMPHYLLPLGAGLLGRALTDSDGEQRVFWAVGVAAGNTLVEIGQHLNLLPGGYDASDVLAGIAAGISVYILLRLSSKRKEV